MLGDAFIARQVADVKAKRPVAMGYVATSAIACFGTGFIPIPFTTPAAALTAQTILWNQIAALYRFDKIKGMTSLWTQITTSKEALVTLTVTTIADFFIFDPITSSFAGGTAATFVFIVGFALTKTFEELAMKELDGVSIEEIENLLQAIFRKNFDKYKSIRIREKKDVDKLRDDFLNS